MDRSLNLRYKKFFFFSIQVLTVFFRPVTFLNFALIFCLSSSAFSQEKAVKSSISPSIGSGFFISNDGFIVTVNHVINDHNNILVKIDGEKNFRKAVLVNFDKKNDLALLKIEAVSSPVVIAEWPSVPEGMEVYVMGYPLLANKNLEMRIAGGIIGGIFKGNNPSFSNLFLINAPIQKGNSGGPVFSADGKLIGVVKSKLNSIKIAEKTNDIPQNINFAIKSSVLLQFLLNSNVGYTVHPITLDVFLRPYEVMRKNRSSVVMIYAN